MRATVSLSGTTRSLMLQTFAVCKAPLVVVGRLIAPRAVDYDGLLDVCRSRRCRRSIFSRCCGLSSGDHLVDPRVTYVQTNAIGLGFDRQILVNTDGEVLEARDCVYSVLPRAATFLGARSRAATFPE